MRKWVRRDSSQRFILGFFAVCFILLISAIQLNNSFFLHAHKLSNGRIAYHSHYFAHSEARNSSGTATHEHSRLEQLFYFLLSVIDEFLLMIFIALSILFAGKCRKIIIEILFTQDGEISQLSPRSPPLYCS